jgi:hypothetical protein
MSKELEALPDKVRFCAVRMRELMKTIENGPVADVAKAIPKLKKEIDMLFATIDKAEGRRSL